MSKSHFGVEPCAGRAADILFVSPTRRHRSSSIGAPPPTTFGRRAADARSAATIFWHDFQCLSVVRD